MFVTKHIEHQLQQRKMLPSGVFSSWHSVNAEIHQGSRVLTFLGRAFEALRLAESELIENYGHCHDFEFRVVTRETSVTTLSNPDGKTGMTEVTT